ncbi:MAG: Carbonic anhydrase, beta class [uncultured Sphingosinicella sp.]|uniref:Carbonic anhydrase n=1 Tax=uncultured Sphingosinicella sp. TaxID=478748 RepID=A0A6J4UF18_9SPHN|nr:carbonic anhydrase [uncultured Sphingosinicella sp.]CAA9546658.1 MAG: Carbonic anhydrase, beta class [uncultured Sphingosinicella sp.]
MADFNTLIAGYRRFREQGWSAQRERWSLLAEGQSPKVMIIACSDSRVDPGQIFDANPGEMFVVRNVANLVPPYEPDGSYHGVSAALEFAVTQLQVREIIVMGHGFCGGCAAALTGQFDQAGHGEGHFIAHWINMLTPARDRIRAEHPQLDRAAYRAMEHEGVRISLQNLRTFPWVAERERAGVLTLHGAFFAISDGVLHLLDEGKGAFKPA